MSVPPLLEPEAVANLRAINPDDGGRLVSELVNIFLTDTPQRLAELDQLIAQKRAQELGRTAHALKGSAGNFGATRFVALCLELEQMGRASALAEARAKLHELQAEFARIRPALESLKNGV